MFTKKLIRRLSVSATLVAVLVGTAACGSGTTEDSASGGADPAFPITIETAFGDVTIPDRPDRVVALGWGDAETALALGVQPVGASDWLSFGGEGIGPWAEGLYDDAPTIIGTMEPEYEQIAALAPDVILDVNSSGDPQRYELLSQIAPVVAIPPGAENWAADWRQQMTIISTALGKPEEGTRLIAEVDDMFAEKRAEFPQFEGKTIAVGSLTVNGWGGYVDSDQRVEFAEALGFVNSPAINALAGDSFSIPVSAERLDLLDANLTVIFPIFLEPSEVTDNALLKLVPSVANGHLVVFEDAGVRTSFTTGSVLALKYALEKVPPILADAL